MKHEIFEIWLDDRTGLWTLQLPASQEVFRTKKQALEASIFHGTGKQMKHTRLYGEENQ